MANPVARSRERARLAGLSARRKPTDPELLEAQRDYRALALADHIERVAAAAPPLTPEQLDRLASLLSPTSAEGSAA
jgi:hypothetical protein